MRNIFIIILLFSGFTGSSQIWVWEKRSDTVYVRIGTEAQAQVNRTPRVWGTFVGTLSNQTDLQNALNAKASSSHTHSIGDVTGLQAALDGKASTSHTHTTLANVGTDAGSNDTYVISLSPAPGSYTTGMMIVFKANTVNTGAATINVNGLGAKTIVKRVSTALANGDIPALSWKVIIYDGTNFTLLNPVVN